MKNKSLIFITLFIFVIGFAAIFFSSCAKDELEGMEDIQTPVIAEDSISSNNFVKSDYNTSMEQIAKELSMALKDVEFRRTFKEELMKKFDGDYDVLYLNFKEKQLKGSNLKVKQLIEYSAQHSDNSVLKAGSTQNELVADHVLKYGNLQFSMPIHAEEWDCENYHPVVVYKPEGYSDDAFTFVKGFDKNSTEVKVSNKTEPDMPVIVVGHCERTDINGELYAEYKDDFEYPVEERIPSEMPYSVQSGISDKLLLAPGTLKVAGETPNAPSKLTTASLNALNIELQWKDNATNETGFYIYRYGPNEAYHLYATVPSNTTVWADISGIQHGYLYKYYVKAINAYGASANSNAQGEYGSARTDGSDIYIKALRIDNISYYEGWLDGAPEIMCSMAYGDAKSQHFEFVNRRYKPNKRKDIDDTWWYCKKHLTDWIQQSDKYCYTLHFYEDDWVDLAAGNFYANVNYAKKYDNGDLFVEFGGSLNISIDSKNNDKQFGQIVVKWWDEVNKDYNCGDLDIRISNAI